MRVSNEASTWLQARMSDYLDTDFVLQGTKPPVWEHQGYLSNTQLTSTTNRLSQKLLYHPDNYRDPAAGVSDNGTASVLASPNASRTSSARGHPDMLAMDDANMKKSVTFHKSKSGIRVGGGGTGRGGGGGAAYSNGSPLVNGNINGDLSSNNDSDNSGSVCETGSGYQMQNGSKWFTQPVHKKGREDVLHNGSSSSGGGVGLGYSSVFMKAGVNDVSNGAAAGGAPTAVSLPKGGPTKGGSTSTVDSYLSTSSASHPTSSKDMSDSDHLTSMDRLARDYFPVTLGAAYQIRAIDPAKTRPSSPPAKGLPKPNPVPWKQAKRSKSPGRKSKSRPSSAHSSSSSTSKSSIDKLYMMSVEAPGIGSSRVLACTPYQMELAKLRMDRLRIEEDHLLEVKRRDELERIRGPQPKWYELKGPQFHYEAHKNTELLQSKESWQELLDYRTELESASKEFQQKGRPSLPSS